MSFRSPASPDALWLLLGWSSEPARASCRLPRLLCGSRRWRTGPLQPPLWGSAQTARALSSPKAGVLLNVQEPEGSAPVLPLLLVSRGAPASLGFVSSAVSEAVTPTFHLTITGHDEHEGA